MYQYIIIKGSEWLYNRLDMIGYSLSYEELMKRIWKHDRTVSKELLKEIIKSSKKRKNLKKRKNKEILKNKKK